MLDEFDLGGSVAMVTGGNRGIGRGIALGLARAGADIAIAARDEEATAGVVAEVLALGRRAIGVRCDVTDRAQVKAALDRVESELGGLSILVNNAAIGRGNAVSRETEEDWDAILDTNLKSVMFVSQAAYPALASAGGGKILNVSSNGALWSTEYLPAYGVSKAGMLQLTQSMAIAWARKNIQVNAILPGTVRTNMQPQLDDPAFLARLVSHTPARRVAEPEEFGAIAVFLCSKASSFITGQALLCDGGATIRTMNQFFVKD